ncbi:DUF1499 domain-containing protein [Rhizobium sp. CRIBSB]|nr:DUF1499 domain-containing protein [Rhizobium sp. CRIBSB]
MAKSEAGHGLALRALTVISLVAPMLPLAAMVGVQGGLIDPATVFKVQTLQGLRYATIISALAALVVVGLALRTPGRRTYAMVAAVGAWGTLALVLFQDARMGQGGAADVTSNPQDPPGFSRVIEGRRAAANAADTLKAGPCAAAMTLPTQVTPQAAAAALERAGFVLVGAAAFRAEGTREGYWFGLMHDAVIRIRPGQTDIRVTARTPVERGEEACRLAGRLSEALRETS